MDSRTVRPGAEDEKKTAKGLPSFDTQLPVSNTLCTKSSTIHSFHVSDFGTFDQSVGFCLENAVNLSGDSVFNSAKASGLPVPSNRNHFGTLDKTLTSFTINPSATQVESQRLQLEKGQQTNLISVAIGNTENWGESNMADASPRTDISTDADTDEKNQRFDIGKSNAVAVSDSSDRSKSNLDQKTLRRLAQNREAARKSRLRKKAYVQQLESSRLKLTQFEQELQRARQQCQCRCSSLEMNDGLLQGILGRTTSAATDAGSWRLAIKKMARLAGSLKVTAKMRQRNGSVQACGRWFGARDMLNDEEGNNSDGGRDARVREGRVPVKMTVR